MFSRAPYRYTGRTLYETRRDAALMGQHNPEFNRATTASYATGSRSVDDRSSHFCYCWLFLVLHSRLKRGTITGSLCIVTYIVKLSERWSVSFDLRNKTTYSFVRLGTGIRGLMRGMANLPQGNQELLAVREKLEDPRWAWGKQVHGMWYFPFSALTLLVGQQDGHLACKKLDVSLLVVMIWLQLCTTYSSSCHHHLHHPLLQ